MAGHSKWANIKHKKALTDAKRGKVFSQIIKKISSAARRGGGDPSCNPELRMLLEKARASNVPGDNISRAILKATGQLEGMSFEDFAYEGYGPGGIAVICEGSTDNRNRTVAEVRHAFAKNGGSMGDNGCVAWMFTPCGHIVIDGEDVEDGDELMMLALDVGADDVQEEEGFFIITSAPEDFLNLRAGLIAGGFSKFVSDERTKIAQNSKSVTLKQAQTAHKLIEYFENHDDIENVYTNMEMSSEVAEALNS